MEKNKNTIDDWNPILLEYPFVYEGMLEEEYHKEKEYWGNHLKEAREGTYLPLWKQEIICRILKILEKSMDGEVLEYSLISHAGLNISETRWCKVIKIMTDEKYILGVEVKETENCSYPAVTFIKPEITLRGLEYLQIHQSKY